MGTTTPTLTCVFTRRGSLFDSVQGHGARVTSFLIPFCQAREQHQSTTTTSCLSISEQWERIKSATLCVNVIYETKGGEA